jgi:hypothetical protein
LQQTITLECVCVPSEDVVAREIEGELVIVPLVSGIGNTDEELFTLNETGHAIWRALDGKRTLRDVTRVLAEEYDAQPEDLEIDVIGLVTELAKRRMLAVVGGQ